MPIESASELTRLGQSEFYDIDRIVMGRAFALHNEVGRFLDERFYRDELAELCESEGLPIQRELEVRVSHKDFFVSYFIDFVGGPGGIYELKTVDSLGPKNEAQLINYLLLTNQQHGKLINFRPSSVESRFVSSRATEESRKSFTLVKPKPAGALEHSLSEILGSLLQDWGVGLEIDLYKKAIIHFAKGENQKEIKIARAGKTLGTQCFSTLDDTTALHVSAITQEPLYHETHLRRLLQHTELQKIVWVNFNRSTVQIKGISSSL